MGDGEFSTGTIYNLRARQKQQLAELEMEYEQQLAKFKSDCRKELAEFCEECARHAMNDKSLCVSAHVMEVWDAVAAHAPSAITTFADTSRRSFELMLPESETMVTTLNQFAVVGFYNTLAINVRLIC